MTCRDPAAEAALRQRMAQAGPSGGSDSDEDVPEVPLEELLDMLTLEDQRRRAQDAFAGADGDEDDEEEEDGEPRDQEMDG